MCSIAYIPSTKATATPSYGALSAPLLRDKSQTLERGSDIEGVDGTSRYVGIAAIDAQPDTGNTWTVPLIDDYYGGWYYQDFECVLKGTYGNIWIGLNDTVWPGNEPYGADYFVDKPGFDDDEWHFFYPWSYEASIVIDPAYPDGYHDIIYGKNLTYVLGQFDNNIWKKDTKFFGMYADRPGPLVDHKIQILIFNIRDDLFWDPLSSTSFIEGYFWSYASELNNANIFHMDTWQWYRRLGPDPVPSPSGGAPRPYEYVGTFAHEFQHLIHYDIDSDEMSWVNEGCSQLAIYICGYGIPASDLMYYFWYFWDTSLVTWYNNLENYGVVFLWTFYVYEHCGGQPFIWDLVHEQANGIKGYNNVLKAHHCKDFDTIFQDWAIATYLDDTSFAGGKYGYYGLDIPSDDTMWESIQYELWWYQDYYGTDWFNWQVFDYPNYGYNYPYANSLPYQINYVEFYDGSPALKVKFDGADYTGVVPHSPTHEWSSDGTGNSWFRMGRTFTIPATGATLKFWTNYDIEKDYDFGYVEVHDLATDKWYTLPGIHTVTTLNKDGYNNPSCPDEFEPATYAAYVPSRWNGFTGSRDWYQETMDLTPFAGHDIELYFTYWTDPYTEGLGWYVDDIEIAPNVFFDNVESGTNGWTVNAGWSITTGVIPNKFQVNFIQTVTLNLGKKRTTLHYVSHMYLNKAQDGSMLLPALDTKIAKFGPSVMVVANQPGYEHTFGTNFEFSADIVKFH